MLPAARALQHRYYVVSSTWRDNATIYEPTGMVAAQALPPERILVHELDLSYAMHGWTRFLDNGEALRKKFGEKVGFHYSTREDMGLFWSNDPATPIGTMIRSIGGEGLDEQVARNRRLHDAARGGSVDTGLKVSMRKPEDRSEVYQDESSAIVAIHSASGIGKAVLERAGESWPDRVVVRLHLRGLESLKISSGPVRLAASGSQAGESTGRLIVLRPGQPEQALDRQSPLWTEIQAFDASGRPVASIPLQGGHFDLTLPRALFDARTTAITLEWIDFHR